MGWNHQLVGNIYHFSSPWILWVLGGEKGGKPSNHSFSRADKLRWSLNVRSFNAAINACQEGGGPGWDPKPKYPKCYPWDWNICLHLAVNLGKYSMEHMENVMIAKILRYFDICTYSWTVRRFYLNLDPNFTHHAIWHTGKSREDGCFCSTCDMVKQLTKLVMFL